MSHYVRRDINIGERILFTDLIPNGEEHDWEVCLKEISYIKNFETPEYVGTIKYRFTDDSYKYKEEVVEFLIIHDLYTAAYAMSQVLQVMSRIKLRAPPWFLGLIEVEYDENLTRAIMNFKLDPGFSIILSPGLTKLLGQNNGKIYDTDISLPYERTIRYDDGIFDIGYINTLVTDINVCIDELDDSYLDGKIIAKLDLPLDKCMGERIIQRFNNNIYLTFKFLIRNSLNLRLINDDNKPLKPDSVNVLLHFRTRAHHCHIPRH